MERQGQISIFIALGLLVLILISMFIFFAARPKMKLYRADGSEVINYIEQCLLLTTEKGLVAVGRQGGYIKLPDDHVKRTYSDIAYGFYGGRNKMPGLNNIKTETEYYIRENIDDCLGDFQMFPQYDIIKGEDIQAEIIFADKNTISIFTMPFRIRKGDDTKLIDEFSVDIPVRFKKVYDLAYMTMDFMESYPGMINLTFLEKQDIDVNILTYDDAFVYVFEDRDSDIEDLPYRLMLGVERNG